MKTIPSAIVVMVVLAFLIALVGCSSAVQKNAPADTREGLDASVFPSREPTEDASAGEAPAKRRLTGSSIASRLATPSRSAVERRWSSFTILSPCSKLSDDTWPTKDLSTKCFTTTSSTRKLRIINDLDEVTRDGYTYKNQIIRVLKYNNVMTISASDFTELIDAGTELLQPGDEPITALYPEIISTSSGQKDFTISGASGSTVTYDLGIMIGQWDMYGSSFNQWVRNMQGVVKCDNGVVNKIRFFRVTHPPGKMVTIRLSSLFPNYSFLDEGYCSGSSSGGSLGGLVGSGAS